MNVLDLFSGAAGGWSLGLHRAGFRTVAACEVDPWRRAIFGANFPEVRLYDDIRTLTAVRLAADGIGPIDVIAGSPPCQDASTANTRGSGVDGDRTGLFFEFVRLVGELRPRWVCAENVTGIRTRGVDRVLAALEASDYTVWPLVVGADHVGAPHRRRRVWIVGRSASDANGGRVWQQQVRRGWETGADQAELAHDADADSEGQHRFAEHGEVGGLAAEHDPNAYGREPTGARRIAYGRIDMGAGADGGAARDADKARLAQREGKRGDAREEQSSALGAIAAAWSRWNACASPARGVDDGLPARLAAERGRARRIISSYGDAVVPAITEAIGRAIMNVERMRC